MENIDPLGIHTGESMCCTITDIYRDKEYNCLRRLLQGIRRLGLLENVIFNMH